MYIEERDPLLHIATKKLFISNETFIYERFIAIKKTIYIQ